MGGLLAACTGLICLAAGAAEDERRYTGLAVTWYFGAGTVQGTQADLSFGSVRTSVDVQQDRSVLVLPFVQVPLIQQGRPSLAPVSAIGYALGLFDREAPAALAPQCENADCAALERMLPDF